MLEAARLNSSLHYGSLFPIATRKTGVFAACLSIYFAHFTQISTSFIAREADNSFTLLFRSTIKSYVEIRTVLNSSPEIVLCLRYVELFVSPMAFIRSSQIYARHEVNA